MIEYINKRINYKYAHPLPSIKNRGYAPKGGGTQVPPLPFYSTTFVGMTFGWVTLSS